MGYLWSGFFLVLEKMSIELCYWWQVMDKRAMTHRKRTFAAEPPHWHQNCTNQLRLMQSGYGQLNPIPLPGGARFPSGLKLCMSAYTTLQTKHYWGLIYNLEPSQLSSCLNGRRGSASRLHHFFAFHWSQLAKVLSNPTATGATSATSAIVPMAMRSFSQP
jgi:hypothetical protein